MLEGEYPPYMCSRLPKKINLYVLGPLKQVILVVEVHIINVPTHPLFISIMYVHLLLTTEI